MNRWRNWVSIPGSPHSFALEFAAEWFARSRVVPGGTEDESARVAGVSEGPAHDARLAERLRVSEPDRSGVPGDDRLQERPDDHDAGVDLDRAGTATDEAFRGPVRFRGRCAGNAGGGGDLLRHSGREADSLHAVDGLLAQ